MKFDTNNWTTVKDQACKKCEHILEFGSTATCPFCEERNEEQKKEITKIKTNEVSDDTNVN